MENNPFLEVFILLSFLTSVWAPPVIGNSVLHSALFTLKNFLWMYLQVKDMYYVQGLPSGFDLMYLALADRNMQVKFGLKVAGESWVVGIWPMTLWFG